ncbi:hypothetical protein [Streptomyces sp. NPDC001642]|uniref:hypothetical protein n=1 Tax=Streptomyces sp. NPDC001642 TaxID=3154392 RepID=UPI00332DD7F7
MDKAPVTAWAKPQKLEFSSGLNEAIAELPGRQFEVIVLRYRGSCRPARWPSRYRPDRR